MCKESTSYCNYWKSRLAVADLGKLCCAWFVCSDLLFGFLEFLEFKLKYVVPTRKARINPYLAFLPGVCYLFFQAICNLHMTQSMWEDRDFVIDLRWAGFLMASVLWKLRDICGWIWIYKICCKNRCNFNKTFHKRHINSSAFCQCIN